MCTTASVKEPAFAALVAIDWADREHAWCLELPGQGGRESGTLAHTPESIEAWAAALAVRFEGRPIAVALEQARGALLYALSQYGHLVLYPIHPSTSSRYRAALFPAGTKDDPKDASLLLDLLVHHRDRLRPLQPDSAAIRKLRALVERRRQLVDLRTAHSNRLTDLLKLYFPQVLNWFDQIHAPIVAAFLTRWPTLVGLQAEDPQAVRQFFHQHGSRSLKRIDSRLEEIRHARVALTDASVIDPCLLMVQCLLEVMAVLHRGIAQLEQAIEAVAAAHPDYAIFASFPGAGPALAPRLLAAFGSQRERFSSAAQMQAYSGIAPVTVRSGSQLWVHFRWGAPKFVRQSFHEFAALSIQQCGWAKAFYQRQRKKQAGHAAAVRALAFKWLRILFRCWRSQTPYQEHLYLASQQTRAVPLSAPPPLLAPSSGTRRAKQGKPVDAPLKTIRDLLKSFPSET